MAVFKKTELELDHSFDPIQKRHYINGDCVVLHCHHFTALYTQLADDAKDFQGEKLLRETTEDSFYPILVNYFKKHSITTISDRISIAEQYYSAVGFGKMNIVGLGNFAGNVTLEHSHIDEGWMKKWGKNNKPINFITQGFIAAAFSAVNDKPTRSYNVQEVQSIVCGAKESLFKVVS